MTLSSSDAKSLLEARNAAGLGPYRPVPRWKHPRQNPPWCGGHCRPSRGCEASAFGRAGGSRGGRVSGWAGFGVPRCSLCDAVPARQGRLRRRVAMASPPLTARTPASFGVYRFTPACGLSGLSTETCPTAALVELTSTQAPHGHVLVTHGSQQPPFCPLRPIGPTCASNLADPVASLPFVRLPCAFLARPALQGRRVSGRKAAPPPGQTWRLGQVGLKGSSSGLPTPSVLRPCCR